MTDEERKSWQCLMKLIMMLDGLLTYAQNVLFKMWKIVDDKLEGE